MRKYAIGFIFCTLFLFNPTLFAAGETSLQGVNLQNYKVQKIYQNFSNKLNTRINQKLNSLNTDAKDELGNILRLIESDFRDIDGYVRTQDRTNGIARVNHINTLVGRIQIILSTGKPTSFYVNSSNTDTSTTQTSPSITGKSETNDVSPQSADILYYADNFEGAGTSGGNKFSQSYFSSANCVAPLHSFVQVISGNKGVIVKNNDRPNCRLHPDIIDLSTISFQKLAPISRGRIAGSFVQLGSGGQAFTKQYIPSDYFSSLQVTLDANIPNAYLQNETFHISGRVNDSKDSALLFFILPNGKRFDASVLVNNGRFSFSIPLADIGKYRLVVASGQSFETTQFFDFQVFDPSVFQGKKLFADSFTPIDTLEISRQSFRDLRAVNIIDFPGDAYREVTISQGDKVVRSSGVGDVAFFADAFKNFQVDADVRVQITASHSSTNFSHDTYTAPVTIFDKTMKLVESWGKEKNEKLDASLQDGEIHVGGFLSPGARVEGEMYVTVPNGSVETYDFDSQYLTKEGLLKTDGLINQIIPSPADGLYVIEVNYDTGFAALNTPIVKGNTLPFAMNPEDKITKKDIESISLATAQNKSITQVNALRKKIGTTSLSFDPTLNALAKIKAQDMADNNYVGHTDSKGGKILTTAKNNNIEVYGSVGENVAGGNISVDVLIAGLMMSGGHRKNMLDSSWTKMGVGYVEKNGKVYYVQLFGE